ncbi:hypothetical protein BB560_006720, partial [Smittium megazygosporum]
MSQKLQKVHSVAELSQIAYVKVNPTLPIKLYINSVENLLHKADTLLEEGNLQEAYLYYLRYTSIVLNELPKHPSYNDPEISAKRRLLTLNCKASLDHLEKLQPVLVNQHNEYKKYLKTIPKKTFSIKHYPAEKSATLQHQERKFDSYSQSRDLKSISPDSPLISMGNNDSGWNDWSLQKELGEIPQQLVGKKKVLSSRKVDIDPNTFRYPRPTVSQENRNLIQKDHSSVLSARDYFFKEKHSEVVT